MFTDRTADHLKAEGNIQQGFIKEECIYFSCLAWFPDPAAFQKPCIKGQFIYINAHFLLQVYFFIMTTSPEQKSLCYFLHPRLNTAKLTSCRFICVSLSLVEPPVPDKQTPLIPH